MSDKLTNIFDPSLHFGSDKDSKRDPRIVEIVKFMARMSAEKDYNEILKQENSACKGDSQ